MLLEPSTREEAKTIDVRDASFSAPPGFEMQLEPPSVDQLKPRSIHGEKLVGMHILCKWPRYGWLHGVLAAQNQNSRLKQAGNAINFIVDYPTTKDTGEHSLRIDNYAKEASAAEYSWVLLRRIDTATFVPVHDHYLGAAINKCAPQRTKVP